MTTADALKGLVGALRRLDLMCLRRARWLRAPYPDETGPEPADCGKCRTCEARAALAAFESRGRLRDDPAFMEMLKGRIFGGPTGLEHLADAIEAALFGPATKEGERRG